MSYDTYDYIIVGGGIAGTVVASRLHKRDPSLKVLLIEAGPDSSKTSLAAITEVPTQVALLRGSELDWNNATVPQKHLDNREVYSGGGKALGGGSVINYGIWARGQSTDYDIWASTVGSSRFSWEGMLPYFKKTETHYDRSASPEYHGHHGPVSTASVSSSGRNYALRDPIREAWSELGITQPEDINNGSPLGLAEVVEARTKGQRVIASAAYPLTGTTVLSSTLVHRVLITTKNGKPTATGVELADGRTYSCTREVIISCGSFRTPQVLLLSGIGPSSQLSKHSIPQIVENPHVGRNLWDHLAAIQQWKLQPEYAKLASSIGSPAWTDPRLETGSPIDWFTTSSVPIPDLKEALSRDLADGQLSEDANPLLSEPRCHLGLVVQYVGMPLDGTSIITYALNLLPTSRGTVELKSRDPNERPLIDNHHYETEADRYRIREAVRLIYKMMNTKKGREMVIGEAVPEGRKGLSAESSDEEIDAVLKMSAMTIQHPAGTASMGKVVDTDFKVKGVEGLRVVDASVIPTPIAFPLQACVYALGEQAVDIILGKQE
ncbi:hypothetical protein EG329_011706 [Mollisiaceae sp. DMI_Dod_QoI]|nr:hypothetical protein EG329_011706 [Helotiales sp. DMI_Dod_QoI]